MLIEKVINNNTVVTRDNNNREIVLMGKGIGFCRSKGDAVDEKKIEKRFEPVNAQQADQFSQLVRSVPKEHLRTSLDIIEHAQSVLGKDLSPGIYISLTDHISFALKRAKEGLNFETPFEHDVKMFYGTELAIGEYALKLIQKNLHVRLPQNEATSIALHIINAEYNVSMKTTMKITDIVSESTKIVEQKLGVTVNASSLDYMRFITHLKFLCQRLFTNNMLRDDFNAIADVIMMKYQEEYTVAKEIAEFIQSHYGMELNRAEEIFLTVHVCRLRHSA